MNVTDLQAKRASLIDALGEGALRVVFMDGSTRREVEYRSAADIKTAIAIIDGEIAALSNRARSTIRLSISKGY